ncbi:MAG: hypothetical protein E7048_08470 [Lentisphaerae bacterium]|nr:hypothetical protein [Lentisphaerota bacterium]
MEQQESTDVLTRGRGSFTTLPKNNNENIGSRPVSGNDNFTAHNPEFDRRTNELRKRMVCDRAAAEAELSRLGKRCDLLKEFLFEHSSAAENLENLNSIINAEKEFSGRLEQLELRYYKLCGRVFENPGIASHSSAVSQESDGVPHRQGGSFREYLPLLTGMIVSALIIALTLMLLFL